LGIACRASIGTYRRLKRLSAALSIAETIMARKYSKAATKKVARALHKEKKGTLKSGRSGKKVKSRKQAIAIGLSEARKEGKKVPAKKSAKTSRKTKTTKKTTRSKS
jgi:hypothetical protein